MVFFVASVSGPLNEDKLAQTMEKMFALQGREHNSLIFSGPLNEDELGQTMEKKFACQGREHNSSVTTPPLLINSKFALNSQVEDVGSQKSLKNCHISYPNTFPSLDDGFTHPLKEFFEQMRAPVRTIMTEITELTRECRKFILAC